MTQLWNFNTDNRERYRQSQAWDQTIAGALINMTSLCSKHVEYVTCFAAFSEELTQTTLQQAFPPCGFHRSRKALRPRGIHCQDTERFVSATSEICFFFASRLHDRKPPLGIHFGVFFIFLFVLYSVWEPRVTAPKQVFRYILNHLREEAWRFVSTRRKFLASCFEIKFMP